MTINPVTRAPAVPVQAPVARPGAQHHPAPQPAAISDTVQLSSAAQAVLKEVLESSAQTSQEAAGGDMQAQRLLARETAERAH